MLYIGISGARTGCRQRPIVFVAHSLGGLVVKQALIEAKKQTHDPDLRDIYDSTHAVIFFGTPHRGSRLASWSLLLSNIAQAVRFDTNSAVLRDLDPESGSSKLEELKFDFDDILRDWIKKGGKHWENRRDKIWPDTSCCMSKHALDTLEVYFVIVILRITLVKVLYKNGASYVTRVRMVIFHSSPTLRTTSLGMRRP